MVAAFAAGRFFAPKQYAEVPLAQFSTRATTQIPADNDDLKKLSIAYDALKAKYDALVAQRPTPVVDTPEAFSEPPPNNNEGDVQTEAERAEHEARRKEMQQRRAEMRSRMLEHQAGRMDFLSDINTELLTEEQQAVHQQYTEALALHTELMNRMMDRPEDAGPPSEEDMQELREAGRTLFSLREQERDSLFEAMGLTIGLSEEELPQFTAAINEIVESTSDRMPRPPRPPRAEAPSQGPRVTPPAR